MRAWSLQSRSKVASSLASKYSFWNVFMRVLASTSRARALSFFGAGASVDGCASWYFQSTIIQRSVVFKRSKEHPHRNTPSLL